MLSTRKEIIKAYARKWDELISVFEKLSNNKITVN